MKHLKLQAFLISLTLGNLLGCGNIREWGHKKHTPVSEPQPEPLHNPGPSPFGESAYTGRSILNLADLVETLNLHSYHAAGKTGQNTTVAILDNGFTGLESAKGITLPKDLVIQNTTADDPIDTVHGTKLAEIVWAVATGKGFYNRQQPGPQLRLYVTSGPYKNLERAVDDLIRYKSAHPKQQVIALYSQIWEAAGNLDGEGYINALINRAIDGGVIWVNAAGNLGESSYKTTLQLDEKNNVVLPLYGRYLRFEVKNSGTPVKITLAWSDFKNSYYFHRSSIDLNLILEDDNGNEMGRGQLVQDGNYHGKENGYSRHPREAMTVTLDKGFYRLRAEATAATAAALKPNAKPPSTSTSFSTFLSPGKDGSTQDDSSIKNLQVWAAVNGADVIMEQSNGHTFVFPPADNPKVIAVGASDVTYSNGANDVEKGLLKPDVMAPSRIQFADGITIHGTSTAAAVAAGAIAVWMDAKGLFTRAEILAALMRTTQQPLGQSTDSQPKVGLNELKQSPCQTQPCSGVVTWNAPLLTLPEQP